MSKNKTIGLLVLLIVIVGAGFAVFNHSAPVQSPVVTTKKPLVAPVQTISPSALVTNFYTWYLQGISSEPKFKTSSQYTSTISSWLTPEFSAKAQTATMDPFILSSTTKPTWLTSIQVGIMTQTIDKSTVRVTLGKALELESLDVQLTFSSTTKKWSIASITSPTKITVTPVKKK